MTRKTFTITLGVRSPFLFAAIEPSAHGVDSSALRMANEQPCLPGDHLRGHLRHAAKALFGEQADQVKLLFGAESLERGAEKGRADEPQRGALIVGDLVEQPPAGEPKEGKASPKRSMSLAHRVKIDADTGAAEEGMLQVIELAAPPNKVVMFQGAITVRPFGPGGLRTSADIKETLNNLLLLVSHVGALKSAGFGEIVSRSIVEVSAPKAAVAPAADRVVLDLTFDRPILVDVERVALNVLVGRSVVPGAALKGALAEALKDAGVLSSDSANADLSRIGISHAFPVDNGKLADRAIPSALVCASSMARLCFAEKDLEPLCAIGTPSFPGDWKDDDWDWAQGALGRPASGVKRQARGRVAIDKDGIAEDAKLFVTDLVESDALTWRVTLTRNDADPKLFAEVVAFFTAGFAGLGRTGACVTGRLASVPPVKGAQLSAGRVVLLLETPTVMTDVQSALDTSAQYLAYFRLLLGDGVKSLQSIATRRMAGEFYAHRYPIVAGKYLPFELTEAGSTFALDLDATAAAKASVYLAAGLPPLHSGALLSDAVSGWGECPFMPQNGFGEISVLDEAAINSIVGAEGRAA